MKIHREGAATIVVVFLLLAAICSPVFYFLGGGIISYLLAAAAFIFWCWIIRFFRVPARQKQRDENAIYAPCDGKVVVVEEVFEPEFLQEKCRQISIFMSPNNVHVNLYPVSGVVEYQKYHPGKFLVAWHPKSSTDNERTTVVVNTGRAKILFRQIAGAVARRIVCYAKAGDKAEQNSEMGFIKFGSRVDVFVPLSAKIEVALEQKTQGGQTVLARY
ncbi:MAG: phosphatidylserine decarboxylase family protein [Prevotellaceae bacterium]|jgi:phosphatidylserine decarboxylase|nr:phosphatidylserine decarboxylase family protein [Prevotellaceae bacterium]